MYKVELQTPSSMPQEKASSKLIFCPAYQLFHSPRRRRVLFKIFFLFLRSVLFLNRGGKLFAMIFAKTSLEATGQERTVIHIDGTEIGSNRVILMAGPCAIESKEQLNSIAQALRNMGVSVLRGSAYKPRTSPYSFQGLGEEGLKIHQELKKSHGMLIETEVVDPRDVAPVSQAVDILRIGARNMQNYGLLREVAAYGKPVILKRGMSATIEEWLLSAEYILAHGNPSVILCERGIRTFESATRATLDLSSIPVLKQRTHLPIIVDPSHAAGRKDLVPALAKAAIAVGADGLLIEVHQDPARALCDGMQAMLPSEFFDLVADLQLIAQAVGRTL